MGDLQRDRDSFSALYFFSLTSYTPIAYPIINLIIFPLTLTLNPLQNQEKKEIFNRFCQPIIHGSAEDGETALHKRNVRLCRNKMLHVTE
jgi:hypothetical protein